MKTSGFNHYGLATLCVIFLFIGMVQATDLTPVSINTTQTRSVGYGHPPVPQFNVSCLEQQGVTTSDVQAALEHNETAALRTWHETCRPSRKEISGNTSDRYQNTFRTGTDNHGNQMKPFPALNLSMHRTRHGITPGFLGNNITLQCLTSNATICQQGLFQNGTIMHPFRKDRTLNGTDISQNKTTRMNMNITPMKSWPYPYPRLFQGDTSGESRSGHSSPMNATWHKQEAIQQN